MLHVTEDVTVIVFGPAVASQDGCSSLTALCRQD
jgi:hypothetical protein